MWRTKNHFSIVEKFTMLQKLGYIKNATIGTLILSSTVYTTQIQSFSIIIKNLENRKNKYEKIIQIIFIEYYNKIHINCSNLNIRIAYFINFRKGYQGSKSSPKNAIQNFSIK